MPGREPRSDRRNIPAMTTYQAVQTKPGEWAVEWYADHVRQGLVWENSRLTEGDAVVAVLNLTFIEYLEVLRSVTQTFSSGETPPRGLGIH